MKIFRLFAIACLIGISASSSAQVAINASGNPPDGSAMLDITSTDRGILIPRMTEAQRNAISSPATGLLIFQTDNTPGHYYYDGSGWVGIGTSSGVSSVSATAPVESTNGSTPVISMAAATSGNDGYLSSTDWSTFNNKADDSGVTDVTGTGPISSTGGTTPEISIAQANASTDGYLSSTDWNTFNNKADGSGVTEVTGTGVISVANGTTTPEVSISQATTSTDGYLSSTDWNTFNDKEGSQWTTASSDIYFDGGVGIGTSGQPASSSILELNSTNKGLLLPRLPYANIIGMTTPAEGLLVYRAQAVPTKGLVFYDGSSWIDVSTVSDASSPLSISGQTISLSGTVSIANGGTGATTVTGARSNLGLGTLAQLNLVNDFYFDGATAQLSVPNGGTGATSFTANQILYGNGTSALSSSSNFTWDESNTLLNVSGEIKQTQISASLTDGTPTDAEIDSATGTDPGTAGAGYRVVIKDSDGSGLLYIIESDGTDWFYTVMTKAL